MRKLTFLSTLTGRALVWLEPLRQGLERTVRPTWMDLLEGKKEVDVDARSAKERAAIICPKLGITNFL